MTATKLLRHETILAVLTVIAMVVLAFLLAVVLEYKGRVERVLSAEEAELTNGLVKMLSGEKKKVYFVQGHGEHDIEDGERTGYNGASAALRRDNYEVAKIVLAQEKDLPADASVVIIAGPPLPLSDGSYAVFVYDSTALPGHGAYDSRYTDPRALALPGTTRASGTGYGTRFFQNGELNSLS